MELRRLIFFVIFILSLIGISNGAEVLPPQPLGYHYIGCYVDGGNGNRDLVGLQGVTNFGAFTTDTNNPAFVLKMYDPDKLTLELCAKICSYGRFRYFGTQGHGFCSCGSTYGKHGSASAGECPYDCYGNTSQQCGGDSRNSVYEAQYTSFGPKLVKLPVASMPSIITSSSSISHRSESASSAIECAAACHRSPDCLACAFVESGRMCRLMRFAAVPSEISSEAQWVWMKL